MSTLFQRAGMPARRAQPTPTVGLEPPFGGSVSAPKLSDPCPEGQALVQRRRSVSSLVLYSHRVYPVGPL